MISLHFRFAITVVALIMWADCTAEKRWETALPRDPTARAIVEQRCRTDAKEIVNSTIEGVSVIRLYVEGNHAFQDIFIDSDSSGISYSKPWTWRYNPVAVEVDQKRFPDPGNKANLPVGRYSPGLKQEFRTTFTARIGVSYSRVTTDEEESHGVYGRTIKVLEIQTKRILGERTEFFWMSPPGFQKGILYEGSICPSLGPKQTTPKYFFMKVVNPMTLPCFREYSESHAVLNNHRIVNWDKDWPVIQKKRNEIEVTLKACYEQSVAKLPNLLP